MTRACPLPVYQSSNRLLATLALSVASLAALSVPSAKAASASWTGTTNGIWGTNTNWSSAVTPDSTYDLTILGPGNVTGALNINIDAAAAANSINFTNTAATTLTDTTSGSNQTLTLGSGGLTTSTGAVTIGSTTANQNINIALGTSGTWNVGSGGLTVSNVVSGSGIGLTKTGAGTLTLAGANTYNGGTTISAGTVEIRNNSALGTSAVTLAGGTLQAAGSNLTTTNNFTSQAGTTSTLTLNGVNWNINGNLSGSGNINRSAGTNSSIIFGGDNGGFTGTFTEASGANAVTRFSTTTAGSANASWVFNNTALLKTTMDFTGTISFGSLTGGGTIDSNIAGAKATISVGALGLNDTFSGVIRNGNATATVALTKVGTGTMTLSGASTYTGATTVTAGTLLVNGSLATGSAVSVTAGTLGGAGNGTTTGLIGGATVLSAGAKLSPGASAGSVGNLTFSNGLDLSASSNNTGAYIFNLDTVSASDKITLTSVTANALNVGTLDAADFTFTTGGGFGTGVYVLFDANSAIAGSIGTASVDFGGGITGTLSIDGVNNDVLLTVVPEPSTVLLSGLGFAAVLWRFRRARA